MSRVRVTIALMCVLGCSERKLAPTPTPPTREAPTTVRVFVSNEDSGDISVIDPALARVVQTIPVGKRPRGLRLSPDQQTLYVAVSGSPKAAPGVDESTLPAADPTQDGLAVIDVRSARLVRTIASGSDPESFDLSADGRLAYVSNEDSGRASVVDLQSGQILHSVEVGGEPEGVRTCPDGDCVYVTSEEDAQVAVIDTRTQTVATRIATDRRPRNVAFAPELQRAFVSNEIGGSLTVIDTAKRAAVGRVELNGARPMGLAMSPDGRTLFATLGRTQAIAVIDVDSLVVRTRIEGVGARPWGIGVNGGELYTANGPSNDVSVIRDDKVVQRIPVGRSPWGIAVAHAESALQASPHDADALERLTDDDAQWVMPAKNYQNTRFSRLDAIRADNVGSLEIKWGYATGISRGHEAAPLVVGTTMYLVTPFPNRLIALDLRTQPPTQKWIYDPEPNRAAQGVACCDVVNRGASYAEGKIIYNTLDTHTIAVDAESGHEVWRTKLGDINRGESMTMAPLIVRDKVLVGNSGGEFGVRGWISALDLDTGVLAWRAYHTGPDRDVLIGDRFRPYYASDRGPDLGIRSWPAGKWQQGGGTVWGFVSYDPALDVIFYGTGNPGPWNPEQRLGDNKWTAGVFARRPHDGDALWFYQWSPHDQHDYDGINENVLVDLAIDGRTRPLLLNASRTGYLYVIDRTRGEVLSATPFAHITTSDGVDLKTGRLLASADRTVGVGRITRNICPASPGGKDWQPTAYSPETKLLYIPANNLCEDTEGYEANYIAGTPYVGTHTRMYAGPGGKRGRFHGWDVAAKKPRFTIDEEYPVWSGVLVTHGKIAFYGTMDGWFKAVHAETGRELWKIKLESGINGQPITWRGADGKQYVSVFAGVGGWAGAAVSGDLKREDTTAALGFVGATGDLQKAVNKGGTLYTFGLP